MPDYRCYPISSFGAITGPAQLINSIDDASALVHAHEMMAGTKYEVWQGERKVYPKKLPEIDG